MPVLIVQGEDDQYGTVRQIEVAQEECYCPVEVALLPGARHSPQREAPEATLKAISEFVGRLSRANDWVKAAVVLPQTTIAAGCDESRPSRFALQIDGDLYSAACLAARPCCDTK